MWVSELAFACSSSRSNIYKMLFEKSYSESAYTININIAFGTKFRDYVYICLLNILITRMCRVGVMKNKINMF